MRKNEIATSAANAAAMPAFGKVAAKFVEGSASASRSTSHDSATPAIPPTTWAAA